MFSQLKNPLKLMMCDAVHSFMNMNLTVRRVDAQVDGNGRNAFILPRGTIRLRLDLLTHLVEIRELLPLTVQELGIF